MKPKSEVAYVTGNSTIRQGIEKLKAHRYTAIPVLDEDGSYVGTVNEGISLDILLRIINLI